MLIVWSYLSSKVLAFFHAIVKVFPEIGSLLKKD
jgi:hypothetical protein